MEIYGTIEARNTINGALGVGGVSGGGGSCDFDTKIIPYDNRITANTNNITALQTEVASLDNITESLTDDVNENIRDIEALEANKADKSEIPNVPSWAMQSNKPSYNASEITNNSSVTGQTVKDALETLEAEMPSGGGSIIYSDEEQEIGVFFNQKLYRKSIITNTSSIDLSQLNIDILTRIYGTIKDTNLHNRGHIFYVTIPYPGYEGYPIGFEYDSNTKILNITGTTAYTTRLTIYINLEYTKGV